MRGVSRKKTQRKHFDTRQSKQTKNATLPHRMGNTQLTIGNERVLVERKLGAGGFSQVFLARSPQTGRQYALKVMGWSDQSDLKKIQHEIDIHRKMSESEYCVRLFESAHAVTHPKVGRHPTARAQGGDAP